MPNLRRFALPALFTLILILPLVLLLVPRRQGGPNGPGGRILIDAIDGDWCHADGRRLRISGPRIVTPGGSETVGDYRRHAFAYRVPASEPEPGSVVFITQRDDRQIQVRRGPDRPAADAAAPEAWHRCAAAAS